MFDTTLMDLSSHMSCQHMDALARDERDAFHSAYVSHFTRQPYVTKSKSEPADRPPIEYVHRKMCVDKNYSKGGEWAQQFSEDGIDQSFDVQTKSK